ncbi:MAG: NADH-quinone oxidoreductase subunit C [Betaproteobacteria bacterium AqS2]|uniref:NADH-quinone oxidoreductase subunit C n=1 Tax=Candidatus Amphirhobacter heronislandensis TaxID=1732024 RepID=A0A930UHW8_9GAMM|nr:NADH-quinone oxidoreductase subunit C [Betaproteobacteria bacterium AqS2]
MQRYPAFDPAALAARLEERFAKAGGRVVQRLGEVTLKLPRDELLAGLRELRDGEGLAFDQLIDLCGMDYSAYGAGHAGLFTRDAMRQTETAAAEETEERFAVVYHLLSTRHNQRLRVRSFLPAGEVVACPSATEVWPVANWFEREAFDLFGIVFEGHPDLRRLLTDYGFIGHPFRKDFPVYGEVEMRYDPDSARVVYQPVSIEPREVVPRVVRKGGRSEG